MPYCFVPGCKTSNRNRPEGTTFHKVRKDWLKIIQRPENTVIIQQRICSLHFEADDFEHIGQKKQLKPGIIPTQKLPTSVSLLESLDTHVSSSLLTEEWVAQQHKAAFAVPEVPDQPPAKVRRVLFQEEASTSGTIRPDDNGNGQRISSSDKPSSVGSSIKRKRKVVKMFHTYSLSPMHYKKQIGKEQRTRDVYKRKLKSALRTNKRRKAKILHLSTIVQDLRKRNLMSTFALDHLEQTFQGIPLALMKRMMCKYKRGTKTTTAYPEELKQFAMSLQFYSQKAYNYVRRTFDFALPAPSTIRSWLAKVNCDPGFSKPSFTALQAKCERFAEKQKNKSRVKPLLAALMLDEMAIKKHIETDPHNLKTVGYVDLGTTTDNTDTLEPATEALVLMVVGINSNFKLPIGYFFINKLSGVERANLVQEALRSLHEQVPTLKVVSLTCDGPQVHVKMMETLGCKITDMTNIETIKTYFEHPVTKGKIYVFFDVAHMLKLMRNALERLCHFQDPDGNLISWNFIADLFHIQEQKGLYLGNKLRKKHMEFKKQIMKVNLAAQTLSSSVADALEFLAEDLVLPEFQGSHATIKFIRTIDGLFDLLNSRNPFGQHYKTPMRKENEDFWKPFLLQSLSYLSRCTLSGTLLWKTRHRTPFIGFIVSCLSALSIYRDEVIENQNLKYLLNYKFSQDHLELFFCSILSRNGWITNPTCLQFTKTYKRLLLHNCPKDSTGNCVAQDQTATLTVRSDMTPLTITDVFHSRKDEEINKIYQEVDTCLPIDLSEYAENVVSYIAGYIIKMLMRQISCVVCLEAVHLTGEEATNDPSLKLILRKSRGGLLLPSPDLQRVCFALEKKVKTIYTLYNNKLPPQRIFLDLLLKETSTFLMDPSLFHSLANHVFDTEPGEVLHKKKLLELIIRNYLKIRLHSLSKTVNADIAGSNVRKSLSRLIIFRHQ